MPARNPCVRGGLRGVACVFAASWLAYVLARQPAALGAGRERGSLPAVRAPAAADSGPRDPAQAGSGACHVRPPCASRDPTNSAKCYESMTDGELRLLIDGDGDRPFDPPVVCGEVVSAPGRAREILGANGCTPCLRLKREALALIFNIRRSALFGDGKLGQDGAACYGSWHFRLVLRCGEAFVPDPGTADPKDALTVTWATPLSTLVEAAGRMCELADCPPKAKPTCGRTIANLANVLQRVNTHRSRRGDCSLCRGDTTPPTILCPPGPVVLECQGPEGVAIDYRVSATDDCDPSPHVSCHPPPGTVLAPGSTRTVECTAVDLSGNASSCSFEVTVVDRTPPEISCPPGPVVVDCVPGPDAEGAVVSYPAPTAVDLCDGAPTVSCDPPSGSLFPLGPTTVRCAARDAAGNVASCSFEVVVVEETPLELHCPGDIRAECEGPGGAVVEYPTPVLSATCDAPADPVCDLPSGSLFPPGTTRVSCRAVDGSGSAVECGFDVTVEDTRPPFLTCPRDIVAECSSALGTPVSFEVLATDRCDPQPLVLCDPPSGSLFPLGLTEVLCTAIDASGNAATCSFSIAVVDTTPPDLHCPEGPIRVDCLVEEGAPGARASFPYPLASDACDDAPEVTLSHLPGGFFPLGSTTVTATATDQAGNVEQCSFEVEVVDATPPSLVCPADMVVECLGPEGAVVEYPVPVVADVCDRDPVVVLDPPPGSPFPPGTTAVTATAVDDRGNAMGCTFEITVADRTPPDLACPGDRVVECAGPDGAVVAFEVGASDACDPEPVVIAAPPSGSLFPTGVTVVECIATDASGNQSRCAFDVHVVDTAPPRLSCPSPDVVEAASPEGTVVAVSVSAWDACGGEVSVECDLPPGGVFPLGVTPVTCTATDSYGNAATCVVAVTVVDTTPPSLACPPGIVTVECTGGSSAVVTYPRPVVLDNADPDPVLVCDPPPETVLPLGAHTVTCTATDASGNRATCTFQVVVEDTSPPGLNCGSDLLLEATGPEGAAVPYELPTAADSCDAAPNLACLPLPGTVFPIGSSEVTCTADDSAGNMIACAFTVRVVDTTPPVLECPGDLVRACSGSGGAAVSFDVSARDLCDPSPTVEATPPSGSTFPVGATEVTATATDRYGNRATCVFRVTVEDRSPPEISCPESFSTACLEDGLARVEYPPPVAIDGCDPAPTVVLDPPSGSSLPRGAHVVRATATDAAGNQSSCEFTVTVVDETPPALVCPPDRSVECAGPGGAVVEYELPVATDACDGERPVSCSPPSGSAFPAGQTEVVCEAADLSGNTVRCSFIVEVRDATPPAIACPATVIAEQTSPEGTPVDFAVTVEDACDPAAALTVDPPPGSVFPPGNSTVVCTAVDAAGNASECRFTVSVVDTIPPDLTCPDAIEALGTTAGNPAREHETLRWPPEEGPPIYAVTAVVSWDVPAASDAAQREAPQVTSTPASGARLELGAHIVTVRARDLAGNESTCAFDVTVVHALRAFIRGDSNLDARLDIADAVWTVSWLFTGGPAPRCMDAADANDDGNTDLADAIYTLNYNFQGGPQPPDPFLPLCGLDPTDDALGCERYYPCE